jgi:small GTP-binding protein
MSSGQRGRYKVLVCGKTNTGKTSLIRQYVEKSFIDIYFPTPLPMASSASFSDSNGIYELAIWDTAGADEWLSMNTSVYHSTHVIIFVASFDEQNSLADITQKWVPLLRRHVPLDGCVKILAINKADIKAQKPAFTQHEIEQTSAQFGAEFFEVSAKQNTNVSEMFEYAAEEVRRKFPAEDTQTVDPPARTQRTDRKRCC